MTDPTTATATVSATGSDPTKSTWLHLTPGQLTLWLSGVLVLFYNSSFWTELLGLYGKQTPADLWFVVSFFVVHLLVLNLLLSVVAIRWVMKPALTLLLISTSLATYFMNSYGVLIDQTTMQSVYETDWAEVHDLIDVRLILYLLLMGVLPSMALWRLKIDYRPWRTELRNRAVVAVLSLVVVVVAVAPVYSTWVSVFHEDRRLAHLITPENVIVAQFRYLRESLGTRFFVRQGGEAGAPPPAELVSRSWKRACRRRFASRGFVNRR